MPLVNWGEGNITWETSVAVCGVPVWGRRQSLMQRVFVLDAQKRPLMPCRPARARLLLSQGTAAVYRRYPFTLILKNVRSDAQAGPLRVKIDPGSTTTGLAVVNDAEGDIVFAAEVAHRGQQVKERLDQRRACRRSRRQRHTRYRPPRFANRRRHEGWLPPSLESRITNMLTLVRRLQRLCPIGAISQELVKFDTQLMQDAEISGVEYQQGELVGYEVREYLLEKWGRMCAYCGQTNVPLAVEHIVPRSRGGSNRVSNLTIACHDCNQTKGKRTAAEWGYPDVQAQAKAPLRDVAAVNATRWALYDQLRALDLSVETGSGGQTKCNRTRRGLPKSHWVDAACVGASTPPRLQVQGIVPLLVTAMGRHSRQMCRTNAFGFPDTAPKATSVVGGFRTGDIVRAVIPATSAKAGVHVGRIAIRASGSCNIKTAGGTVDGVHYRYCKPLHRADGYAYAKGKALPPRVRAPGSPRPTL
jgi:5-methylcytosine-specific restriction endonuclease McrA